MLFSFSIFPVGKGESLSQEVSQIMKLVSESGLDYRLNAMDTVVEGEWDEVFELIRRCHETMRQSSARVITTISIDDREGAVNRISGKIDSVETKLGRTLQK